ncbi:MAG: BMP family ABC transporter substrate-binding protein [Treponemataceae bacterium]
MKRIVLIATAFAVVALGSASAAEKVKKSSIAVFVPGVMSGSPIYEMLVAGVKKASEEVPGTQVKVIEGGFNQAEWESKLTSLAATGSFELLISSNPAIPALCSKVSERFPKQKFLLLDGHMTGNPNIYTLRYNQREQSYLAGFIAGLATTGGIPGANKAKRIGLVAGQEYPAMNGVILPGYREGAHALDPAIEIDFRVVGNWYDAAKGAELASSMIRDGADVVLTIAGGANQGVVQAASNAKASVVWFDIDGYAIKPGVIIGSAVVRQDKAAYEQTKRYLAGTLPFGKAETVGVKDGYVGFIEDSALYISTVPEATRKRMAETVSKLRSGKLALPMADK